MLTVCQKVTVNLKQISKTDIGHHSIFGKQISPLINDTNPVLKLSSLNGKDSPQEYMFNSQSISKAPFTHYRLYIMRLQVFSAPEPPPQVTPFHLSCSHYRRMATDWTQFLTVNNSSMTVLQTLVTVKQPQLTFGCRQMTSGEMTNTLIHLMSPYYTKRRPNHNLMYTVDHTFGYHSKRFIRTHTKFFAHAHGTEIRGGNFKHLKTSVGRAR